MGCAGSKLEDQEAVALCRERTLLLADAIRHRYALADAHAAYSRSLRSVGAALHAFLQGGHAAPLGSPVLPLPTHRKGDPLPPLPPSPLPAAIPASTSASAAATAAGGGGGGGGHHSRSHSGSSHIQFQSSDDDSDDDEEFHLHSHGSSPVHLHPDGAPGPTFVNVNYARNHPTAPSISYEQRPQSPEPVHFGSSEPPPSAYPYYDYAYPPQNQSFYPYPYPYPSYGGVGGFFGSSSPPPNIPQPPTVVSMASPESSKTPPPPPSPPRASTWDFLNPFESYDDNYYVTYTPSRSSKEVREEEGIPDLEDEEHEVVKEAYGDQKSMASTSAAAAAPGAYSAKAAAVAAKEDSISDVEEGLHRTSKSGEGTSDGG